MKVVAVVIFSFLLLTQTFSKWLLVLEYELNREYIATNLCENRSKPKLQCGGTCQLAKKMITEERGDQKTTSGPLQLKASLSEVLFDDILSSTLMSVIGVARTAYVNFYTINKYTTLSSDFFHPPLI